MSNMRQDQEGTASSTLQHQLGRDNVLSLSNSQISHHSCSSANFQNTKTHYFMYSESSMQFEKRARLNSVVRNEDGSVTAPTPSNEAERLSTLYSYNILDSEPEPSFDDITLIASRICDVNLCAIAFVDKDRIFVKSSSRGKIESIERIKSFCSHAINYPKDGMEIPDALEDERFCLNPFVTSGFLQSYTGIPLVVDGDKVIGTICVLDKKAKKLTPDQLDALRSLSRLVVNQLDYRKRNDELKRVVQEREEARRMLEKSQERIQTLNEQLQKRNHQLEQEIEKLKENSSTILNTPAESVIKTLTDFKSRLDLSAQDSATLESVIAIIGSHKLYTVDVSDVLSQELMDKDTKDFLMTQFQVKKHEIHSDISAKKPIYILDDKSKMSLFDSVTDFIRDHSKLLEGLDDWSFDVFKLNELSGGHALLFTSYHLLERHGLIEHFKIDKRKLLSFLYEIERGYKLIPYHNSIHATDVLIGTHYFLAVGKIKVHLEKAELLSALLAALIHDFRHPGLTNSFLVNTKHPLAILHNDISVLENFHCAEAFSVIQEDQSNFLSDLPTADAQKIRTITIDLVLSTDMARHVELLGQFQNKMSVGFDYSNPDDRLSVLRMALKCADISNPAKPTKLCLEWASRIMEEFFQHGDHERALGLPISAFMDRNQPNVQKCQIGFISFIALPTYRSWCTFTGIDCPLQQLQQNLHHWQNEPTVL